MPKIAPNKILKDLDLLKLSDFICLSPALRKKFLSTIYIDS